MNTAASGYTWTYQESRLDLRQCMRCKVWSLKFTKDSRAEGECDSCFGKPVPSTALALVNPA